MRKNKKAVSIILVIAMIFAGLPTFRLAGNTASAAEKTRGVQTYETSKSFSADKMTATASTNGEIVIVSGTTLFEKAKSVNVFLKSTNTSDDKKYAEASANIVNGKFTVKANTKDIPTGEYYVLCRFDKNWDYFFRDVTYQKKATAGNFVEYTDILENNKKIITEGKNYTPELYKDKTLKDDFVVKGALTSAHMKVIDSFTDKVVSGAKSNYDKLKKMYEYLGNTLYYDTDAFNKKDDSVVTDPYALITKINKGEKVKTVCDGYAGLMIAMARNEGIPCRLVQGTVRTAPNESWDKVGTKTNHTWVEAYVDGRWIIIDATRSTNKRFEGGQWIVANPEATVKGLARYQYFDPSIEFFSNAYRYEKYRNGSLKIIASNTTEYKTLQSFLARNNNENGKKVNVNFNANDMSTWYNSTANDPANMIETNGFGKTKLLSWQSKGLFGSLNLAGLSELKNLLIHSNKITSLDNLNDCVNLEQISANSNQITSLDASNIKKLKQIKLENNPLRTAKFNTVNGQAIKIQSSDYTKGTFSLVYDGTKETISVKAYAKEGVDFLGCYDKNGKNVATDVKKQQAANGGFYYTFNLGTIAGDYILKFETPKQLEAPTVTATVDGNAIKISWKKVSGASGYEIYRAPSKEGTYTKISEAPANWISITNKAVDKGETYYYKIRAFKTATNGNKEYGRYSDVVWAKVPGESIPTVQVPTGISTEIVSSTNIRVRWNGVDGATKYQIYKATSKDGKYSLVSTVGSTYRSLQCTGLDSGKTYYFKVRAIKVVNGKTYYSSYSTVVNGTTPKPTVETLATPTDVTTERVSRTNIRLRWDGVPGAEKYQIYRSTVNKTGTFKLVSTVGSTYRSLQNTGLTTGTTYYWKMRAYKVVNGKKVYSNYSKVVSATAVVSAPPNVKTEVLSSSNIRVKWGGVSGASGYQIYRSSEKGGSYKLVRTVGSTYRSLQNTGLSSGKTYYFKVRAYRTVNGKKSYGAFSNEAVGTTIGTLKAPTGLSTERVSSTNVRIKWSEVSGADGYQIFRSTINKTGTFKRVSTVNSKYRSLQNTGLVTGKSYYWKMRAYKVVNGKTIYSPYSKVVTRKTTLAIPRIVSTEQVKSTNIRVKWNGVSDASGYQIFRSTVNKTGTFKLVSTVGAKYRSLQNTKLVPEKMYYWKMRAYKIVDGKKVYSDYSKVVSGKTVE